ncbi:MAG: flagellar basal body P-ring formation chaperone FlgA [Burkholderiaceae bacterium]
MNKTLATTLIALSAEFLLAVSSPVAARQTQPARKEAAGQAALESFVRARVGDQHRVEITFGKLPNGTKLAPCRKIEPFLAPGARLWGRSQIGVRCKSGARWTIAVPINVRVFGEVLVATRQLRARVAIDPADVELSEIELTRLPSKPLSDLMAVDGQMTTRSIRTGQPIMAYHLRTEPTIARGDPVRIRVNGRGFSVVTNGSALVSGSDGKSIRVRTATGKVVAGVLNGRTVTISM